MKVPGKLVVIASQFLSATGQINIGGIETYIQQIVAELTDFDIIVIQPCKQMFQKRIGRLLIIGVQVSNINDLVRFTETNLLQDYDILIFSTEQYSARTKWPFTIVIQHGVYWDLPTSYYAKRCMAFPTLYKWFDNIRNLYRIKCFKDVVCVDYNYINWYRSLTGTYSEKNFWIIPNCASRQFFNNDLPVENTSKHSVKILFARRFVSIRGTLLFCKIAQKMISNFKNIEITLAGAGPDLKPMQELLPPNKRITYIKIPYWGMKDCICCHDVIVIPSIGSEGTSLIALEAMAAGKCVVASNVGGLTNIIIDGYNGFLCGTEESFVDVLSELVQSASLRADIGSNAHKVAVDAFHPDKWRESWRQVLQSVVFKRGTPSEDFVRW